MNSKCVLKCCTTSLIALMFGFILLVGFNLGSNYSQAFADTTETSIVSTMTLELEQDAPSDDILNSENPISASSITDLAGTGDILPITLIGVLVFATVLFASIYLSKRRLCALGKTEYKTSNDNKIKNVTVILLALSLISGLFFCGVKAFATSDKIVNIESKVIVSKDGQVKDTSLSLTNNLKTPITGKIIVAPNELSGWVSSVEPNVVVNAGETISGTWIPDTEIIPSDLLERLKNDESTIQLQFETTLSYETFNVTWDNNYAGGGTSISELPANDVAQLPATNPERDLSTFVAWNTASDGSGDIVDAAYLEKNPITQDVTYYAIWDVAKYNITYELNGGQLAGGVTNPETYLYGTGVDSFEDAFKQGYDFEGWFSSQDGRNKIESISTTDSGDKTLYARWTPRNDTKYTIRHFKQPVDSDNYKQTPDETEQRSGTTGQEVSAVAKSYTGFRALGLPKKTIAGNGSTVLDVYYERVAYSVSFVSDKEGVSAPGELVKFERKASEPETPTVTGYNFDGWYDNQQFSGDPFDFANTPITKNTSLYAKFTPITYFIQFDKNDPNATGTMNVLEATYDVDTELTTNAYACSGKTFSGWSDDKDGEVKYTDKQEVKNLASTQNDTIILYAIWEDNVTYTITYDATGGEGANESGAFSDGDAKKTETVNEGSALSGPKIDDSVVRPSASGTRAGYTFVGWFTQPNGKGDHAVIGETVPSSDNITYFAYYYKTTFLAPVSEDAVNPVTIQTDGDYDMSYLKDWAQKINEIGASPEVSKIQGWLENDSHHLYTLLRDVNTGDFLDPDVADNWAEFRLIQIREHDGDASGFTFQMVHSLPKQYAFDSDGKANADLNWKNSTLRSLMQEGGEIYKMFDETLTSQISSIHKKYNNQAGTVNVSETEDDKFFILSYTEWVNNVNSNYWTRSLLGSAYTFWSDKGVVSDKADQNIDALSRIFKTRSKASSYHIWQRSVSTMNGGRAMNIDDNSRISSDNGYAQNSEHGVVLAFAL